MLSIGTVYVAIGSVDVIRMYEVVFRVEVVVGSTFRSEDGNPLARTEVGTAVAATLEDISVLVARISAIVVATRTKVSQVEKVQTLSVAILISGVGVIALRDR